MLRTMAFGKAVLLLPVLFCLLCFPAAHVQAAQDSEEEAAVREELETGVLSEMDLNGIEQAVDVRGFDELDYRFAEELSGKDHYIFIKGGN